MNLYRNSFLLQFFGMVLLIAWLYFSQNLFSTSEITVVFKRTKYRVRHPNRLIFLIHTKYTPKKTALSSSLVWQEDLGAFCRAERFCAKSPIKRITKNFTGSIRRQPWHKLPARQPSWTLFCDAFVHTAIAIFSTAPSKFYAKYERYTWAAIWKQDSLSRG